MAAVTELWVPYGGWSSDELPDVDVRYELVDGALLVTPPPAPRHQEAAMAVAMILAPALPASWRVAAQPGLWFDRFNYREPDLLVYDRAASARGRIEPADVHLAVEVMSPASVSTDRVTKPAQYAAAGIPHFWRLELDPLVLIVHRLVDDAYEVVGSYDDEVRLEEPVPVSFRLVTLLE